MEVAQKPEIDKVGKNNNRLVNIRNMLALVLKKIKMFI